MSFVYHEPRTLEQAVGLLKQYGAGARLLAGGTDLMVLYNRHKVAVDHLINLQAVPGLSGIVNGDGIRIGAMTTHRKIELSELLREQATALPEASRTVGGVQIRNLGTLGGNLCNASPAADTVPALLALNAEVVLTGPEGERQLPLDQFVLGPRRTALQPGEILTAVWLPSPAPRTGSAFLKAGRRKAMEISLVCVAAAVTLAADGTCAEVRIGLGAVAPKGIRAAAAEAVLRGKPLTEENLRAAGRAAAAECSPISDVRGSAEYRRMLVEGMVPRAVRKAAERAAAR